MSACLRASTCREIFRKALCHGKACLSSRLTNLRNHGTHPAFTCKTGTRRFALNSESGVLVGREDRYNGLILDGDQLPNDTATFSKRLSHSLQRWAIEGKRGIWLRLKSSQAALLPTAIEAGFDFRHAQRGHVILTKWLASDVPDLLPESATHQVGIGAFVQNERGEVLLVQENTGAQSGQGFWKLPTGLLTLGEDIPEGAVREVFEETGVKTSFEAVLAVRQSHGYLFGRSDLFFVCAMRLEARDQQIRLQKTELAAADWHSLQAAEQMPIFQTGPLFGSMFACCKAYAAGTYQGIKGRKLENIFNSKQDLLIHGCSSTAY